MHDKVSEKVEERSVFKSDHKQPPIRQKGTKAKQKKIVANPSLSSNFQYSQYAHFLRNIATS